MSKLPLNLGPSPGEALQKLRLEYARRVANLPDDLPLSPHFAEWAAAHTPAGHMPTAHEALGANDLADLARRIRALASGKQASYRVDMRRATYNALERATQKQAQRLLG